MFTLLGCPNLFLREVSRRKLHRLIQLAHVDPMPLQKAINTGYFRAIRKEVLELLEQERKLAKHPNAKKRFQDLIQMTNEDKLLDS